MCQCCYTYKLYFHAYKLKRWHNFYFFLIILLLYHCCKIQLIAVFNTLLYKLLLLKHLYSKMPVLHFSCVQLCKYRYAPLTAPCVCVSEWCHSIKKCFGKEQLNLYIYLDLHLVYSARSWVGGTNPFHIISRRLWFFSSWDKGDESMCYFIYFLIMSLYQSEIMWSSYIFIWHGFLKSLEMSYQEPPIHDKRPVWAHCHEIEA